MKDYSKLKGTEILCCLCSSSVDFNKGNWGGFVADIDYKKGITIKHKKTQKDIICFNRKEVEAAIINFPDWNLPSYKDQFKNMVKFIKTGKYKEKEDIYIIACWKKMPSYGKTIHGTAQSCAFG